MSSSGFEAKHGWQCPEDLPGTEPEHSTPATEASSSQPQPQPSSTANIENSSEGQGTRRRRTHWPPRQCRICLETVQPTFNGPSQHLPDFLQSSNVVYEDESGRLIRPCRCKGSSKYVHEDCLSAWRHADPNYGARNYWQCPTCKYQYRLARLGVGRFIGSFFAQIALTAIILFITIFVLGFFADPIIRLYLDPWSLLFWGRSEYYPPEYYEDEERSTWYQHFAKGFASMGVLGFLKVLLASPLSYFRIGGGRGRNTTRERYEQVSWVIILIGVFTFLVALYKGVRAWSRRALERAGERVMDVQGEDDDDDE